MLGTIIFGMALLLSITYIVGMINDLRGVTVNHSRSLELIHLLLVIISWSIFYHICK